MSVGYTEFYHGIALILQLKGSVEKRDNQHFGRKRGMALTI